MNQIKALFLLSFAVGFNSANCQHNHLIQVSISNNGQLSETVADFYFEPDSYNPADDVFSFTQREMKVNLHYELAFEKGHSLTTTVGYGYRKDEYVISNQSGIPPDGSEYQSYFHIALGVRQGWSTDRIQLSTGLELPLYLISDCEKTFVQEDPNRILDFTTVISGGHALGLSSITSIKWYPTSNLFVSTNISFGLLAYNIGDVTTSTINRQDPIITSSTYSERENTYKRTALTPPELFIGIGFMFGQKGSTAPNNN